MDGPVAGPSSAKKTPAHPVNGATTNGTSTPTSLKTSTKPAERVARPIIKELSPEPLFRVRAGRNKPNFTPQPKPAATPNSGSALTPVYVPPSVPDTIPPPGEVVYEPLFTKRKGRTPARLLKANSGTPPVAKTDHSQLPDPEPLLPKRAGRTPLAKNTSSNRGTPVPAASVDGKTKKGDKATPESKGRTPAKPTPGSTRKGLASGVGKPLPTQSASVRKRARVQSPTKEKGAKKDKAKNADPVFDFDDTFAPEPSPATISRETFLANEKLRKQREARNFTFEGDANAPKLTRSGRVIGEVEIEVQPEEEEPEEQEEQEEQEEPEREAQEVLEVAENHAEAVLGDRANGVEVSTGPEVMSVDEQEVLRDRTRRISPVPEPIARHMEPLSAGARVLMLDVLGTLSGRGVAYDPPPFAHEDKNEALNGVLHLLKGTVERGEGNSALLVGARGVGKTRVSSILLLFESRLMARRWPVRSDCCPRARRAAQSSSGCRDLRRRMTAWRYVRWAGKLQKRRDRKWLPRMRRMRTPRML